MIYGIVTLATDSANVLRARCWSAETPSIETNRMVENLFVTLDTAKNGVGLSAPQIGFPVRIFVVNYNGFREAFINPDIIRVSENETSAEEGCLSLPGVSVRVTRPKQIWINYTDASGVLHKNMKFKKMEARIIQHEFDHLNGVLITDHKG